MCTKCGAEVALTESGLECKPCDLVWSIHYPPSRLRPDLRPDIVRCGCGVVRNDQDHELEIRAATDWASRVALVSSTFVHGYFEPPRACRGCGCVYVLPKPEHATHCTKCGRQRGTFSDPMCSKGGRCQWG